MPSPSPSFETVQKLPEVGPAPQPIPEKPQYAKASEDTRSSDNARVPSVPEESYQLSRRPGGSAVR